MFTEFKKIFLHGTKVKVPNQQRHMPSHGRERTLKMDQIAAKRKSEMIPQHGLVINMVQCGAAWWLACCLQFTYYNFFSFLFKYATGFNLHEYPIDKEQENEYQMMYLSHYFSLV